MANRTTEQELLDLERQYWEALKAKDAEKAMSLSDEPTIVAGADGVGVLDRKSMGAMMKTGPYSLSNYELKDVRVRLLRDDVGVVAYKAHEELVVEGKPVSLDATDFDRRPEKPAAPRSGAGVRPPVRRGAHASSAFVGMRGAAI